MSQKLLVQEKPAHEEPQGSTVPLRVDFDDLDVAWGGSQYLYDGKPFTGVTYEMHPDGDLVGEHEYRDGFSYGPSREWYGPGELRYEKFFGEQGLDGMAREWHPDGRPKSEALYESGIRLWEKQWDEQGNLTRDWRLTEDDPRWADLMRWREAVRAAKEQVGAERTAAETAP